MNDLSLLPDPSAPLSSYDNGAFNLYAVLPGRASSAHSQRAYYRWVDTYLSDIAGVRLSTGDERIARMQALPLALLRETMSAPQLRAWLGALAADGHGKQALGQARAAIVTLASLLAEAGLLHDYVSASMGNVKLPNAEEGQRPGRWLSTDQIRLLMSSARAIATSEHQLLRNTVLMNMLCVMALRRDEVALARWGDLATQNNRVVLRVHGKGRKLATVDVPKPVMMALTAWRGAVVRANIRVDGGSPLLRRLWKGGRIGKRGITPDGIWRVVGEAADHAQIGHVAPHDLRRSVAGALHDSGVPIDKISRLLRHANVAVTERYLSKLPQVNEGAILMSDLLGFGDDSPLDDF